MRKKIILLILSIAVVIAILTGTSYAVLFKVNETEEQVYSTGMLEITSEATNGSLTLSNSLPMSDTDALAMEPYTFKITNTGNLTYKFNVKLLASNTTNLISSEFIKVSVNDGEVKKLSELTDGIILSEQTLDSGESFDASLRVWLDEYTLNTELEKTFLGKIVTEGQAIYTDASSFTTLKKLGLENSVSDTELTTFTSSSKIDGTTGIYASKDDLGTSYYFRGNVTNNYVYFAGFYWRIIRINGDGSIRMIYDGTSPHSNSEVTTDKQIGTSAYYTSTSDNAFLGYMNGTNDGTNFPSGGTSSTSYNEAHANISNSTIKTYIDNWYKTNIVDKGYGESVVDAIYCNDRTNVTDSTQNSALNAGFGTSATGVGYGNQDTFYTFLNRTSGDFTSVTPSLRCGRAVDKFTVNSGLGNGKLTYPVGLLTADELFYAGGYLALSDIYNNEQMYLYNGSNYFWTLSPFGFVGGAATMSRVINGAVVNYYVNRTDGGVRPVISISPETINLGDGTKWNPFSSFSVEPNSPVLVDSLIPVMYDETSAKWVKADTSDLNSTYGWYNYEQKKWANAVLVSSTNRSTYVGANPGTPLTESDILAYYVWIPRYKYKVWNINKVAGTDTYNAFNTGIDIIFENGKSTTGTITCNDYDFTVTEGNGLSETCSDIVNGNGYYTHPAFTFGDDEVKGFWMAKFEVSNTTSLIKSVPNAKTLADINVSTFWQSVYNMQSSGNSYGLSTDRTNTDSHMMTNMEWGAVAYLTHSDYGRCSNGSCTEVAKNNSTSYYTGKSSGEPGGGTVVDTTTGTYTYETPEGQLASTTGNIYGVYDMSGGATEYVMGSLGASSSAGTKFTYYANNAGSSYTYTGYEKYLTTYSYGVDSDTQNAINRARLGDATAEVTTSDFVGWYNDMIYIPYSTYNWYTRGGFSSLTDGVGIFLVAYNRGTKVASYTVRPALMSFK